MCNVFCHCSITANRNELLVITPPQWRKYLISFLVSERILIVILRTATVQLPHSTIRKINRPPWYFWTISFMVFCLVFFTLYHLNQEWQLEISTQMCHLCSITNVQNNCFMEVRIMQNYKCWIHQRYKQISHHTKLTSASRYRLKWSLVYNWIRSFSSIFLS